MEEGIIYPIYYLDYHKCISCGSRSVMMVDRKGLTDSMIYPVLNLKCRNCGKEFYIKWIEDPNDSKKMIPVSTDHECFENIVKKIIYEAKADLDKEKLSLKK